MIKSRKNTTNTDLSPSELVSGFALKWQQYKAMVMKRFLNSKRDKKAIVTQLVLPLLMVLFGLLLITSVPVQENDPARVLKLSNLSVDGVNSKSFFADYRTVNTSTKDSTFKVNYITGSSNGQDKANPEF